MHPGLSYDRSPLIRYVKLEGLMLHEIEDKYYFLLSRILASGDRIPVFHNSRSKFTSVGIRLSFTSLFTMNNGFTLQLRHTY